MPIGRIINDDSPVRDSDTFAKLFGEREFRDHESLTGKSKYEQFQHKFHEIHSHGTAIGVSSGEVVGIIVEVFGWTLEHAPFGRLDEVSEFVKRCLPYREKWIDPPMYEYLRSIGYYDKSSTAVAPKAMAIGFCQAVVIMMQKKCPVEDFLQLGREISKL